MGHIGKVILEYRKKNNMSRKILADNICSEKYIYLIEKGERTPSSLLLQRLSDKVGLDFFEFYEYLDAENPIEVCHLMNEINCLREKGDLLQLKEVTNAASIISDFNKIPWKYELLLNNLYYLIFQENRLEEGIRIIELLLIDKKDIIEDEQIFIKYQLILSISYDVNGMYDRSRKICDDIYYKIWPKRRNLKLAFTIIYCNILAMKLRVKFCEYQEVIEIGLKLATYEEQTNNFSNRHRTFFYLACGYYGNGNKAMAAQYFNDTLHLLIVFDRALNLLHFRLNGLYLQLTKLAEVDDNLVKKVEEKYPR